MTLQTYGWTDLTMVVTGAAAGAAAPTPTAFGPSANIKQSKFAVNDSIYLAAHVTHNILQGSLCYPHVHWVTDGVSTNTVKWQLKYTYAEGYSLGAFPAETTINLEAAATATAWAHEITEDATGFIIPDIDSIILIELKRITNGGVENADGVFGLFVDMHHQVGQVATPSRSPNFWA